MLNFYRKLTMVNLRRRMTLHDVIRQFVTKGNSSNSSMLNY
jgi:hypothetical protein